MLLIYYYTKDGVKGWKMAEDQAKIEQFIKENQIEDYDITLSGNSYHQMDNYTKRLEKKIDTIKEMIEKIIKD